MSRARSLGAVYATTSKISERASPFLQNSYFLKRAFAFLTGRLRGLGFIAGFPGNAANEVDCQSLKPYYSLKIRLWWPMWVGPCYLDAGAYASGGL